MRSEHQTEESLHAWLDNELSSRESALVGEHVEICESCSATLAECRETRATVSYLLQSYDNTLESVSRAPRAVRDKVSFSARVPSAPIINHIVVNSKSIGFWPAARTLAPIAAAAVFFVGGAALVMMRSYHAIAGSVNAFASTAHKPFVSIDGKVFGAGGRPLVGITVSVAGTDIKTETNELGYFIFAQVPRSANALVASGTVAYRSTLLRYTSGDGDEVGVNIRMEPMLRTLNPVVTTADSVPVPPRNTPEKPAPKK